MKKLLAALMLLLLLLPCLACGETQLTEYTGKEAVIDLDLEPKYTDTGTGVTSAYVTADDPCLIEGVKSTFRLHVTGFEMACYDVYVLWEAPDAEKLSFDTCKFWGFNQTDPVITFTMKDAGRIFMAFYLYDSEGHCAIFCSSVYEVLSADSAIAKKADQVIGDVITSSMSNYDKVKALHDWIILNTEYEYGVYGQDYAPGPGQPVYHIAGVLVNGKAVCQGYAQTYQLLLKKCGITSVVVQSMRGYHAWNLVYLDGSWYHVDCTWDDQGGTRIGYEFFLLGDDDLRAADPRNHIWNENDEQQPAFVPEAPYSWGKGYLPDLSAYKVLYLPANVTSVDKNAFTGCAAEVIVIPPACTSVGEGAFSGCTSLQYIYLPNGSELEIDSDAAGSGSVAVEYYVPQQSTAE